MTTPRLIAVSGKAGAGKSSIVKEMDILLREMGYHPCRVSFAEPIKSTSREILLGLGLIDKDTPEQVWKSKYRCVPQALGTHLRSYRMDLWVDLAVSRIKDTLAFHHHVVVLNDDCRLPAEAHAIHGLGGKLVRLNTDLEIRRSRRHEAMDEDHDTETGLDRFSAWDLEMVQSNGNVRPPKAYAAKALGFLGFKHPQQQTLEGLMPSESDWSDTQTVKLDPFTEQRVDDVMRHEREGLGMD